MASHSYFVVMIDYGKRGREAIVDPELTHRDILARLVSGEYTNIDFIHRIKGTSVEDVTGEFADELEDALMEGAE